MNERVMQFRVGVVVLATVIIAAIMVLLVDGFPTINEGQYSFQIVFSTAPGISAGTPVRKSGILIGRVSDVKFAEDLGLDPNLGVVVTVKIDSNRTVYQHEVPRIEKSLLGGDYVIEFVRRTGPAAEPGNAPLQQPPNNPPAASKSDLGEPIKPGERITGQVPPDPMQAIANLEGNLSIAVNSIARTSESVNRASNEIAGLASRASKIFDENGEVFSRTIKKAEAALDQIQMTATNLNAIVGDPEMRQNIQKVAKDLPRVTLEMTEALATMRQTLQSADRNLQNIEGLTKPLGERGGQLVANIDRATVTLDLVLRDVQGFSQALNSPEGSLGKLLNDPHIYNQLSAAAKNVNEITRELKPIVKDARAFSDKISRHPESLGVRGALFPNSGIK